MKNDNFIIIQGWMINELKLSGNELIAYSIIYGFSQDGQSKFTGSINYLAQALNCSRPTVSKSLQSLVDKQLIERSEIFVNNVKFNHYKIVLQGVKNLYGGSKETLQGGSKETLHYNTNINKNIIKSIEERKGDFKKILYPFLKDNEKQDLIDFFEYWSEHGINDKKMRFEKEKSFSVDRRLKTWLKNKYRWDKEKSSAKKEKVSHFEKIMGKEVAEKARQAREQNNNLKIQQ